MPPTAMLGMNASRSLMPLLDQSEPPWLLALWAVMERVITAARASSVIQMPSQAEELVCRAASQPAARAVIPAQTYPLPETPVNAVALSIVSLMYLRFSSA